MGTNRRAIQPVEFRPPDPSSGPEQRRKLNSPWEPPPPPASPQPTKLDGCSVRLSTVCEREEDVESANLAGMGIAACEEESLAKCTSLVALDVSDNEIEDMSPLECLLKLRELAIDGNGVRKAERLPPQLRRVGAAFNHLDESAFWRLGDLAHLRQLDLASNAVDLDADPQPDSDTFPCLTDLCLDNQSPSIDSGIFRALSSFPSLRHLSLRRNGIAWIPPLPHNAFPSLESLDLSGNPVPSKEALEALKYCPSLQSIRIASTPASRRLLSAASGSEHDFFGGCSVRLVLVDDSPPVKPRLSEIYAENALYEAGSEFPHLVEGSRLGPPDETARVGDDLEMEMKKRGEGIDNEHLGEDMGGGRAEERSELHSTTFLTEGNFPSSFTLDEAFGVTEEDRRRAFGDPGAAADALKRVLDNRVGEGALRQPRVARDTALSRMRREWNKGQSKDAEKEEPEIDVESAPDPPRFRRRIRSAKDRLASSKSALKEAENIIARRGEALGSQHGLSS